MAGDQRLGCRPREDRTRIDGNTRPVILPIKAELVGIIGHCHFVSLSSLHWLQYSKSPQVF